MGKLTDILSESDQSSLASAWDSTEPAKDFAPLPAGEYVARIIAGEPETSRTKQTPGYKLTFKVLEGEHTGRQFWHDIWLTPAAMSMAKRDLGKLGVTSLEQLDQPLPGGIRCKVKLALRREDDGRERNRVVQFECLASTNRKSMRLPPAKMQARVTIIAVLPHSPRKGETMYLNDCPYGFRIVGNYRSKRWPVDAADAMAGYAACDALAEIQRESYISAFQFGDVFRQHLELTGSTKGYRGPWLWFDIDNENDLDAAAVDARKLAASLVERYRIDGDDLLLFFSGSKGFHVGLPTSLWQPKPSGEFNRVARQFAEAAAERAGVTIDTGVYDAVRAFRAPNSRHPKTGLHKRRLTYEELLGLGVDAMKKLAEKPEAFDVPKPLSQDSQAVADWQAAIEHVEQAVMAYRQTSGVATLNRATMEFIREGASVGDRHRLLYSAAANLAEFDCSAALARALLSESGLDSGLSPYDVGRQIECGLNASPRESTPQGCLETPVAMQSDSVGQGDAKRDTGDSVAIGSRVCQQLTALDTKEVQGE